MRPTFAARVVPLVNRVCAALVSWRSSFKKLIALVFSWPTVSQRFSKSEGESNESRYLFLGQLRRNFAANQKAGAAHHLIIVVADCVATIFYSSARRLVGLVWYSPFHILSYMQETRNQLTFSWPIASQTMFHFFHFFIIILFANCVATMFFELNRQERAEAAMKSAGASVLTGITLTKLVGVSVLAIAPSLLFRVYYFRMYMATVVAGAFQVIFDICWVVMYVVLCTFISTQCLFCQRSGVLIYDGIVQLLTPLLHVDPT